MKKWKDWSAAQKFWLCMGVTWAGVWGYEAYLGDDTVYRALLWITLCFSQWQYDEIKQLKKKLDDGMEK